MKIALFGYGKMGKMIEKAAVERGHDIVLRIDLDNRNSLTKEALRKADCAIEFSAPDAAVGNILFCFEAGVPVVVGTTGWNQMLEKVKKECHEKKGAIIYGSNFSMGVNMLFTLNSLLAKWINKAEGYSPSVYEEHHVHKLDKPSGTAISLAEGIITNSGRFKEWSLKEQDETKISGTADIPVYYLREDEIPGTHRVKWTSTIDEIELIHKAFNREGFARGAVMAAEFIKDKKGFFTVAEMFKELFDLTPSS